MPRLPIIEGIRMRTLAFAVFCLFTHPLWAQQQFLPGNWSAPSCDAAGAPACQWGPAGGQCGPSSCYCQPPCNPTKEGPPKEGPPREGPPREGPPVTEEVPREVGAYIAPPRSGTTRGATRYKGFDLGGITFPECHLRLPSIELPACFRGRTSARMMIDSAVAPWESHGFVGTQAAPVEGREAPSLRDTQDRAATERAACEEYTQKLRQYESELRRMEDQRRALEDCIRQCLEANRGAPLNLPKAEMRCVSPQGRDSEPAGLSPTSQQLTPPQPPVDAGARRPTPARSPYIEQPASYIAEPIGPRLEPLRIVEPASARARITSIRSKGN